MRNAKSRFYSQKIRRKRELCYLTVAVYPFSFAKDAISVEKDDVINVNNHEMQMLNQEQAFVN